MKDYKHLSEEEKQQMLFDWRYRGFTTIELLTEAEVEEINDELNRLRLERNETEPEKWQEYEPFMYPHKLSAKLEKLFAHPKLIEAAEFLMEGNIIGMQTWAYFKPKGELGRDMHQNGFYTGCKHNEIINVAIALDNHDPQNGAVWNYEGSHRLPVLPIEDNEERKATNTGNWKSERGKSCVMPEGHDFRKIEGCARKGQAVILHSHVVHGSEPNRDTNGRMRRNFLTSYLKEGAYFNAGNQMKREPINMYELRQKHWGE
jgi:ectoine hydroxylase-related dioxygenase (phytanoyl-CoA dioxygenase family)